MKSFLRRHLLWVGLAAVLAPLSVLLILQYSWLVDLQKKSAIAHEATLKDHLEATAAAVEYYYRRGAEQALGLPASVFTESRLELAAKYFGSKGIKGVRRYFIMSFFKDDWGKLYVYEPTIPSMEFPASVSESRAIYVAAAPWERLSKKNLAPSALGPAADERDRDNRIILNPIVDDTSKIVGLAGMIVDEEHFRKEILPTALRLAMPAFFTDNAQKDLIVAIHDGRETSPGRKDEAERPLSFIFTDYRIGLSSRGMNPREWAQANFVLNMSLSVALAIALLAGITLALRTASREVRLSQMKSDFVSNVSHELRTPLASIRVFGEFLRLGRVDSPEKAREYGEYIENESRRLTALVNNILDFARIEAGLKTYRFERADLRDVVAETLGVFEVRLRHSGFRIRLEEPAGPLPKVRVDVEAISRAVGNLLDNAVKYSGGSRDIAVRLAGEDGKVSVSVADHGIGIARDELAKVFERFHRVGTGLVHDVRGSGLGLSIVKHIALAHGGSVHVESEPDQGSVFSIRLPAAEGGADA